MNIFDWFDNYQNQRITEFRILLDKIIKSILIWTENIPEEKLVEIVKTEGRTKYFFAEGENCKEGFLMFATYEGDVDLYPYNVQAEKELDKFMKVNYPNCKCLPSYTLNVYDRTVECCFCCDVDCETKAEALQYMEIFERFKKDVSRMINQELTWEDEDDSNGCIYRILNFAIKID